MYKLYIAKDITGEELLKKVLDKLGITYEIVYNKYGKPYLKNKNIYFNISHSNNVTVLVIASKEVGVDIEQITFKKRVINKVCNNEERELIKTAADFTKMWVKKESYVKFLGVGLTYGLKNVNTLDKEFIIKKYENYYIAIYGECL